MALVHWRQTRMQAPVSYESELKQTAYFGTPNQMVTWIRYLRDVHQMQYFGVNMDFGLLTHAQTMRSMELFTKEVIPKFRS